MKQIPLQYRHIMFLCLFLLFMQGTLLAAKPTDPLPLNAHLKKKYTDDLGSLIEKRYIRILTTFNRTNFFLSGSKSLGFEYSLLKEYEKFLNKKIRKSELKVVLEFIPVSRNELMSGLVDGLGDIVTAGLTITPQRLKEVDFTNPYLTDVDEIVVVNKKIKGLKNIDDLSGRKVFVRQSSSYYESLLAINKKLQQKGMKSIRIVKADENLETEDILELVNSGAIGITISDGHIAKIWSNVFQHLQLLENVKVRTGSKIAWMVRKNNPELKKSLNEFVAEHKKGTLLGNIYFNRYYKKTKWVTNPLTSQEKEKLYKYKGLFQKYGSQYGFDWMLIMALAYQESGLDQSKRNPSGATGIMQVLPSTAADKRIGVRNVHLVENNIHAGVKYLALLRDRYFNDEYLRPRDKVRFALAAYNAGPTKIKRIRELAGKMGLNPNRWFRNSEMAALKIIGQETVRYVSNINKYYILFRFAFEKERVRGLEKKKIMRDGG